MRRKKGFLFWFYAIGAAAGWMTCVWAILWGDSWRWAVVALAVNLACARSLEPYSAR